MFQFALLCSVLVSFIPSLVHCVQRVLEGVHGHSGVTSHRQPRQCRGTQGPKTVKRAQSDRNYVSRLLLDCVPVFHKIITPAYLFYRFGPVAIYYSQRWTGAVANVCRGGQKIIVMLLHGEINERRERMVSYDISWH